jgi:hypothetical protein
MLKPSKILVPLLALTLLSAMSCTRDAKPPATAEPRMKEGWDRKQVKVFAYACSDGLLDPAVRDYHAAAKKDGVDNPKPFPEQEFRDSAFPMCLCIAERVSQTWTMAEIENNALQKAQGFVNEALNGGQCKPDGLLGDILKNRAGNRP